PTCAGPATGYTSEALPPGVSPADRPAGPPPPPEGCSARGVSVPGGGPSPVIGGRGKGGGPPTAMVGEGSPSIECGSTLSAGVGGGGGVPGAGPVAVRPGPAAPAGAVS